jgi:hypothetical protein
MRDTDSLGCEVCGALLYSWEKVSKEFTAKLEVRNETPEVQLEAVKSKQRSAMDRYEAHLRECSKGCRPGARPADACAIGSEIEHERALAAVETHRLSPIVVRRMRQKA